MNPEPACLAAREAKSQIRTQVRRRLKALPAKERAERDRLICQSLARLAHDCDSHFAVGYFSLPDEVNIDAFVCAMVEAGLPVLLPRVQNSRICYGRWRPVTAMSVDEAGIVAPCVAGTELPAGRALIVVPGRAFDAGGGRLGRGGGFYDRLLGTIPDDTTVVGVAYECQLVESVPRETHDRDVPFVVTESGCLSVR